MPGLFVLGVAAVLVALFLVPGRSAELASTTAIPGSAVTVTVGARDGGALVNGALLGTNQPVPDAAAIQAVGQLGIGWARTDMSLESSYDCATGAWDPTILDIRVAEDRQMGGTPELIVDYSPSCMTALGQGLEPPDAHGYGPWSALVQQAAYHEITAQGVRVFEVWNEPDGTFWHATLADYLSFYAVTAAAVEAAATQAGVTGVSVGGPALVFADPAWLSSFFAYVSANHLPLDFVSWHYYGDYPLLGPFDEGLVTVPPQLPTGTPYWYNPLTRAQTFGGQVQLVKSLLSGFPQLHPRTVVDEWNLDAGYDPRADTVYDAAFAAAVLDSLQGAGLDAAAFFRIADDVPHTLGNWGMLFSDDSPKPVYQSFAFWHALAGHQTLPVTLSPDQSAADLVGRIGAVAAGHGDGAIDVLVYDYAPYDPTGVYGTADPNGFDHPVTVVVPGTVGKGLTYRLQLLDGSGLHRSSGSSATGTVSLTMPGESVALLQVTPTSDFEGDVLS